MSEFSLVGHSALICGSSSGIGEGMALAFDRAGSGLVLHGLGKASAEETLSRYPYCEVDLLTEDGSDGLLAEAFEADPALDTLICNAGGFFDVPLLEMSRELYRKTMRLNVEATYFLVRGFAERLVAEGRSGSVVITSSTNGFQAEYDSTAYDTSKGALVMMTRSLALSLSAQGIRVNGIAPGFVLTPLTERGLEATPGAREALERKIAMGRLGNRDDCGGAAVFLCSAAARYITGQVIVVDGGLTLGQLPRLD